MAALPKPGHLIRRGSGPCNHGGPALAAARLLSYWLSASYLPEQLILSSLETAGLQYRVTLTSSVSEKTPQMCTAFFRAPRQVRFLLTPLLQHSSVTGVTQRFTHSALLTSLELPSSPWSRSPNNYHTARHLSEVGLARARQVEDTLVSGVWLLLLQQKCLQPLAL